jgi:hypothetical protein
MLLLKATFKSFSSTLLLWRGFSATDHSRQDQLDLTMEQSSMHFKFQMMNHFSCGLSPLTNISHLSYIFCALVCASYQKRIEQNVSRSDISPDDANE